MNDYPSLAEDLQPFAEGWFSVDKPDAAEEARTFTTMFVDTRREHLTIETLLQLEALPPESVIKTQGGSIACRHPTGVGVVFGDDRPFKWSVLEGELPGILLWHPDWAQP